MATYVKFQDASEQIMRAKHDFGSHTFKVALTNTAPNATDTILANITQITAANGYSAGGTASTIGISETGGTTTVTAGDVVFTASGGSIGPLRYAVIYNDSQTSPADALLGYWDYGTNLTITDGNSLTVDLATLLTLV